MKYKLIFMVERSKKIAGHLELNEKYGISR